MRRRRRGSCGGVPPKSGASRGVRPARHRRDVRRRGGVRSVGRYVGFVRSSILFTDRRAESLPSRPEKDSDPSETGSRTCRNFPPYREGRRSCGKHTGTYRFSISSVVRKFGEEDEDYRLEIASKQGIPTMGRAGRIAEIFEYLVKLSAPPSFYVLYRRVSGIFLREQIGLRRHQHCVGL